MKKFLLLFALLIAGAAHADTKGYVRFEYYDEENVNTNAKNYAYALVPGMIVDKTWDLSVQMRTSQAELGDGAITNGLEARVTRLFEVGTFKPYISLRTGQIVKSDETFAQYNVVLGTRFPIAGALSGDVGVRYRNAYDTANNFQTTRPHAGLNYAVTPKDSVGVRYARSYGDTETNQWRMTYTRSF
jgi:hypothetical protein